MTELKAIMQRLQSEHCQDMDVMRMKAQELQVMHEVQIKVMSLEMDVLDRGGAGMSEGVAAGTDAGEYSGAPQRAKQRGQAAAAQPGHRYELRSKRGREFLQPEGDLPLRDHRRTRWANRKREGAEMTRPPKKTRL